LPRAAGLAENILHDNSDGLAGGVLLRPGEIGSFEVYLDGRRIFSKLERDRFPEENEIEEMVGDLLAVD
jgi:selT/selW/selH-like putative selenoprotein